MNRSTPRWPLTLPVIACGILLAGLLSIQIAAPWRYIHDDNGSWTQAVASARLRAGFERTLGQDFFARRSDSGLVPYLHHPPLYGTLAALHYRVIGDAGPLTTRLLPAFFHILGYIGVGVLCRVLFGPDRARLVVTLSVYALVPMSNYFGKMPFNEPVGLCWVVWALVFLARHRRDRSRNSLIVSLLFWVLAGLTSWTAYVILGFHAVLEWVETGPRGAAPRGPVEKDGGRQSALLLLGVGFLVGSLVLIHILVAGGWRSIGLFGAADHWGTHSLSLSQVPSRLAKAADLHRLYFANVPFALYLVWIAYRLTELRGGWRAITAERRFLCAGSLGCLAWALLFLRPISFHAYGQFWFLPFESLALADMVSTLWRRGSVRPRLRHVLAGVALLGTLISSAHFLHYRYTKPSTYALRQTAEIERRYHTSPWDADASEGSGRRPW